MIGRPLTPVSVAGARRPQPLSEAEKAIYEAAIMYRGKRMELGEIEEEGTSFPSLLGDFEQYQAWLQYTNGVWSHLPPQPETLTPEQLQTLQEMRLIYPSVEDQLWQ
jgi:hypothetical protein